VKGLFFHFLNRFKKNTFLLTAFLFISGILFIFNSNEPVNAQSNNEIRVALFVNTGSGYQNTVPMITLQSETGIDLRGETGTFQNIGNANYMRFSLDQFYLIAGETKQSSEARRISQQLAQQGFENSIITIIKNNEQVYRVITGSEVNLTALNQKKEEVFSKTNLQSKLAGPYRLQAGSFASLEEASTRLSEIQAQDISAYITQVRGEGQLEYQVWIGDEVSLEAQLQLLQAVQKSMPDISFQPAIGEEYLIYVKAVILGALAEEIPYYLTSPHKKTRILPKESGLIPLLTVEERSNRKYRGEIELSRYKNHFTVVNILALENYLYSVVGTEMSSGWPLEALKAQSIMSRNYAHMNMNQNKYGIAHLSDTVFEQAYHGFSREAPDVREAVDATHGEFLTYKSKIFSTFYYSNAGGKTALGNEVWGFTLENHSSVPSKDNYPETIQVNWYRVQDSQGKMGYVSSQYVDRISQRSKLGFAYGVINIPSLNYRSGPSTEHNLIGSLKEGERVIIFEEVKQNNAYSWLSGPFTALEIMEGINSRSIQQLYPIRTPVYSLEVKKRGPSGRVMEMEANGQAILVSSPDAHRGVFKEGGTVSLRSTKYEVESMGEYTVLAAGGNKVAYPQNNARSAQLYAITGANNQAQPVNSNHEQFAIIDRVGKLRIASKEPAFRFHGFGFGHGLGASQWGIRAMAGEGYDYRQILQHYFHKDTVIEKKY
jgi:stage II sporulation protein D